MLPVEQPFKIYTGLDGKPLQDGFVYFGQPNQNPQTAPVTVYWDAAGTVPALQPLRTMGGYIVRAGTPAMVFFSGSYSQLVLDSKKRQVSFAPTSDDFSIATSMSNFLSDAAGDNGAALLGFIQSGTGAVPRTVQDKQRETISLDDFLPKNYASTNDASAGMAAAIQRATSGPGDFDIVCNRDVYRFKSPILPPAERNFRLIGKGSRFTGTTFLIDHSGVGIYCDETSNPTFDMQNIVLKSTGTAKFGYQALGTPVYQIFRNVCAQGFLQRGFDLANPFACRFEHIEATENGVAGISLRGGSSCMLLSPVAEGNLGSGLIIGGVGHNVIAPYLENNCLKNVSAGAQYRELLVTGGHVHLSGGVIAAADLNPQLPIEITGGMVTLQGIKPYSKGKAPNWILISGLYANVLLLNSEMDTIDGGSGGNQNVIQIRPGIPGSHTSDVLIGGASVASSAVVSQGSNANGRWTRFADGRQECTSAPGLFYAGSGTNYDKTWTFPQPFVDAGVAIAPPNSVSSDPAYRPNAAARVKSTTKTAATINFSDSDIDYCARATGYWK